MLVKINELIGPVLDWAVAKCDGQKYRPVFTVDGIGGAYPAHRYSSDWSQGGPIIEREKIGLFFDRACGNRWRATHSVAPDQLHHDPLVAAMRCYVALRMGYEIDVPDPGAA